MKKLLLLSLLCPLFLIAQTQIGQDIDGEAANDQFGYSVSLSSDGSIVAIGAPYNNVNFSGHVRIYENLSGVWSQIGNDINGEAANDASGWSVSLSSDGSVVAIGTFLNDGNGDGSGHVRIYENINGVWTQIGQDIDGEAANDASGWSISLSSDGSIIAIGAANNDGNGSDLGHVRIYENQTGTWTQIGQDIDGEAAIDQFGLSVSLSSDGSIVAIGAPYNDGNGINSGHVRIYENINSVWTQVGQDIDGEAANDQSGRSVSLSSDGSIVAIGAPYNDGNGLNSGHIRIYENVSGIWTQIGQDIDDEAVSDESGWSVSLSSDGSVVAIGSRGGNDNNGDSSGYVRVYGNISSVWTQLGQYIYGEAVNDESGFSVSLSSDGSVVAIGARANDGNGDSSGHVRMYDLSALLSSDEFVLSQFSIYPNPAKDRVTIDLKAGLELQEILIYNNLGQQIMMSKKLVVDTSSLNSGLYYLQIKTDKGNGTKKLIIE